MSPRKAENTVRVNVFFSPSIYGQLYDAANERGASVSGLIRMIVIGWLRKEAEEKEVGRDH